MDPSDIKGYEGAKKVLKIQANGKICPILSQLWKYLKLVITQESTCISEPRSQDPWGRLELFLLENRWH